MTQHPSGTLLRVRGRFAPSPSGPLHLGNLRTALVAWMATRREDGMFLLRIEDLDPLVSSRVHEAGQRADLARLGIVHEPHVVHQSERFHLYRAAIDVLGGAGLVYTCYCTRREIRDAASAPNVSGLPDGAYPGTCRNLDARGRVAHERAGRRPALRLRTADAECTVDDLVAGRYVGRVDDVVLQRNDGVPAYNLAVVVDDHVQGITQVVRGDDLLSSTPRHVHLQRLLGYTTPTYAHVPLVLGPDGTRLAKRHGDVTLADLERRGLDARAVLGVIGASLGLCAPTDRPTAPELASSFDWAGLPRQPWRLQAADV